MRGGRDEEFNISIFQFFDSQNIFIKYNFLEYRVIIFLFFIIIPNYIVVVGWRVRPVKTPGLAPASWQSQTSRKGVLTSSNGQCEEGEDKAGEGERKEQEGTRQGRHRKQKKKGSEETKNASVREASRSEELETYLQHSRPIQQLHITGVMQRIVLKQTLDRLGNQFVGVAYQRKNMSPREGHNTICLGSNLMIRSFHVGES